MQISQVFPRRYATAEDIGDQTPTLPIARVVMEKVGPVQKPVVYFFKARKGIVLNATLAREIAAIHGDDTDQWSGKEITLYTVPCRKMDGTRGLSIRARSTSTNVQPSTVPRSIVQPGLVPGSIVQPGLVPGATLRNPSRHVATA